MADNQNMARAGLSKKRSLASLFGTTADNNSPTSITRKSQGGNQRPRYTRDKARSVAANIAKLPGLGRALMAAKVVDSIAG